jgi:CHAT domain-containing protein
MLVGGTGAVCTAQEMPVEGNLSDLQTVAVNMKSLLARGAAADAVRTGNSVISPGTLRASELGYSDIIILQVQGYLKLGMPQNASHLLKERIAAIPADKHVELAPLLNLLAQAAILGGRLDEAEQALEKANKMTGKSIKEQFWTLLLKSHIRYRQKRNADSLKLCREAEVAARTAGDLNLLASAQLQRAQIARQSGDTAQAASAYRDALEGYQKMGDTNDAIFGIISVATGLSRLTSAVPELRAQNRTDAEASFVRAGEMSRRLNDSRALSLSFGKWGDMLESEGQLDEALAKTLQAMHQAQQSRLYDLLYIWQHQTGRILKQQKQTGRALDMYRAATQSLNLFKKGLSSDCGIADGSFQETTKPIYLDLAELLIDASVLSKDRDEEQKYLLEARSTVETLRTEELRDYFEDACLGSERTERASLTTVPPKTALIYTIMFPNRLELLVSLPDGIKRFRSPESSVTVSREVRLLRLTIENRFPAWVTSARKLYDWLLRPVEAELKRQDVTTIVFVPDGPLRNIPLSVLHDGNQSIIEKYAIATIQGLGFASVPNKATEKPTGMLMAGLSESVQGYAALTNVLDEVKGIRQSFSGASLINSDFKVQNVKEQLDMMPYPLIHIASHGEFTGNSRNNYILTWDGRMTLDHLDRFIRNNTIRKTPVELLSLSACKTAAGDDRASLGLAGLAVKSGARTAVASLWDIDDKSTSELFVAFYRNIKEGVDINRAEALRQAQLEIKKHYDHPYFWSPFLLIGNWL